MIMNKFVETAVSHGLALTRELPSQNRTNSLGDRPRYISPPYLGHDLHRFRRRIQRARFSYEIMVVLDQLGPPFLLECFLAIISHSAKIKYVAVPIPSPLDQRPMEQIIRSEMPIRLVRDRSDYANAVSA